jgi:hypothetical protein
MAWDVGRHSPCIPASPLSANTEGGLVFFFFLKEPPAPTSFLGTTVFGCQ